MSAVTGITQGYWWVDHPGGDVPQIVRVVGRDGSGDDFLIVEFCGAGFMSVRRAREKGFEFKAKVPEFKE